MRWRAWENEAAGQVPAFPQPYGQPTVLTGLSKREYLVALFASQIATRKSYSGAPGSRPILTDDWVSIDKAIERADQVIEAMQPPTEREARLKLLELACMFAEALENIVTEAMHEGGQANIITAAENALGPLLDFPDHQHTGAALTTALDMWRRTAADANIPTTESG